MAQMNVSVPDLMKAWCEDQVKDGRYSTTSDYVRDIIRRDQNNQRGVSALQAAITQGMASGTSKRSLDEIFADARTQADNLTTHGD